MLRIVSLCLVLFLCCSQRIEAQNIKVESFSRLENDITARVNVVKDANDDDCALIKMVTTDVEYNVDEGLKREPRVGEIWFYVPQGTKRIVIRHQKLGKLVYALPEILKAKTTYQIKLPDNIEIIVHEDVGGQYLVMNVHPTDAVVYIDGLPEVLNNGILQKMLKYGRHTYRVEAPLYLPVESEVLIEKERKSLKVNLAPDFGFIRFKSTPEAGASIYVDGKLIGKTPITTGKLVKGKHSVKAILPMYAPVSKDVMVEAGQTSDLAFNMSANFAQITLSTPAGEIWVNGERKGTNNWSGRLMAGFYKLETRKPGCRPFITSVELTVGEKRTLALQAPEPMKGTLNASSNETEAIVKIDNQEVGTTPNVFEVLEGKHLIEFSKTGWESITYEILIEEGKVLNLMGVLKKNPVVNNSILKNKEKRTYSESDINYANLHYLGKEVEHVEPRDMTVFINERKKIAYVHIHSYSRDTSKFYLYSFDTALWKEWKECAYGFRPDYVKEWKMIIGYDGYYNQEQDKWVALDEKQPQVKLFGDHWSYIDETVGLSVSSVWGRGRNAGIAVYNPQEKRFFLLRLNCPKENVTYTHLDGHLLIRTFEKENKNAELVGVRWYIYDPKEKKMLQETVPPTDKVTLHKCYLGPGKSIFDSRKLVTKTGKNLYMME